MTPLFEFKLPSTYVIGGVSFFAQVSQQELAYGVIKRIFTQYQATYRNKKVYYIVKYLPVAKLGPQPVPVCIVNFFLLCSIIIFFLDAYKGARKNGCQENKF